MEEQPVRFQVNEMMNFDRLYDDYQNGSSGEFSENPTLPFADATDRAGFLQPVRHYLHCSAHCPRYSTCQFTGPFSWYTSLFCLR